MPLDAEHFIATALQLLDSDRYTSIGLALMALTGRRPAEIFFCANFSLPAKRSQLPTLLFEGQLKTRHAPGTSFATYPIPVLAEPRRVLAAFERLRSSVPTPTPTTPISPPRTL